MGKPLRVLLVEDSEDDAQLLIYALQQGGFAPSWERVCTETALRQTLSQPWEILIADYHLPGFGGLAALRMVADLHLDVPVIIVSGQQSEETAVEVMRAGARDYILKDHLARLAPAITRELQEAVTRRKQQRAEAAFQEQHQFLRLVIDTVPDILGAKDEEGRYLLANRALAAFYDTTPNAVIGKTDADFNRNQDEVAALRRDDQEVIRTRSPKYIPEEKVTDSHGHIRWLAALKVPIIEHDGSCTKVLLATHDITARKQAEEEQELFVHMVSHDLRVPLSIVLGHAQLLAEDIRQQADCQALSPSVIAIEQSARRMNVMIEDLVDIAREASGQLQLIRQAIDLREYLLLLLARTRMILETARITLQIPDDVPPVSADADRLERIILNLLTNALKYSSPNTPVVINVRRDGDMVIVSVTNQGQGIPPEVQQHLFMRFYRAGGEQRSEGIGLGLYITHMLVEAHGGRIWVESDMGKSSTFSFSLPVAAP